MSGKPTEWKCKQCNHVFHPNPPDFNCPKCKSHSTIPIGGPYKTLAEAHAERKKLEKNAWRKDNQSQLPELGEPLVCAFQRGFTGPRRVQCALT